MFGGQSPEDAFKLGFVVFPVSCVTHGWIVAACPGKGNGLIRNLSKRKNSSENFRFNYVNIKKLFRGETGRWYGERANTVPKLMISRSVSLNRGEKFQIFLFQCPPQKHNRNPLPQSRL
ncbi:MAG: hypothetical protein LBN33_04480, partial [Desulfovibrio sp.]|nr:hypothetical protein [Desulfovibrio sp.]